MTIVAENRIRKAVRVLTSNGLLRCHAISIVMRHIKQLGQKVECERCNCQADNVTMSFFDAKMICMQCGVKEERHPHHADAKRAELEAVSKGDFDFPGVGLPSGWDRF